MEPGTLLGHYRVLEPLGKGGMGQVYLVEDTKLDRQVALKVLPPELAADPDRRERFVREAKAVAALNHPNIVVIHSVEEEHGQTFLTMERIEGAPLTHRIAGGAMPLGELFDIAIPLADAISAAHQKGIAHRDLKPDNVMITPEGRVKVLDFGLAKLVEAEESLLEGAATEMLTEEGKILGTVAYMSPEQAQGKAVDGRSDIFALGILLYEMAVGQRPFTGDSKISVLSSLIKDTPVPVTEMNRALPRHLGRIIKHCLEKNPDRRYQSALDVRNELEALREEIRSGEVDLPTGEVPHLSQPAGTAPGTPTSAGPSTGAASGPHTAPGHASMSSGAGSAVGLDPQAPATGSDAALPAAASGGSGRWIGAGALILLVAAGGWWLLGGAATESADPAVATAAADTRQSIAVLPFDNTSGAEDIDWLRDGLAEMLVTDLSQSSGLRVVGSERIREVLNALGRDAEALGSMDTVREVAQRVGTGAVLTGSFVQAGDRLRIAVRLVDAQSGEVTAGESVDGQGQDSVFASIDALSRWLRGIVEPTTVAAGTAPIDRDLVDVTTDSVDAFRFYAEGLKRADRQEYGQAIEFFEEAVRLDPEFALAYVKLSVTHSNLFNTEAEDRYAERALEYADKLSERERYYFEGAYYARSAETIERSVAAYRKAIELYPDDTASRNNLGSQLSKLHRHEEALEHYEEALRLGTTFGGTRTNITSTLLTLGRVDEAERRALAYLQDEPDAVSSRIAWLEVLIAKGDYEEAQRVWDLHAQDFPVTARLGMGVSLALERRDWDAARTIVADEDASVPVAAVFGAFIQRTLAVYAGDGAAAIRSMEAVPAEAGSFYWFTQAGIAEIELERGEAEAALSRALDVREQAPDLEEELAAMSAALKARAVLGRTAGVESLSTEYTRLIGRSQSPHDRRTRHQTMAEVALLQGDPVAALREFEAAEGLLEARAAGDQNQPYSAVYLGMGQALLLLDEPERARDALERVINAGASHTIGYPLARVRAWYFLGQARDQLGDEAGAREAYETFLSYWADRDLDRARVADARAYLGR